MSLFKKKVINTLQCPYCSSKRLWKYLYGLPASNYDKNKYVLGGCEITDFQPTHKCKKCGQDIYSQNKIWRK